MGINAHLVFGEKHRGFHFPNVVIKCSRTHQQTVCSNAIGYLGRQVTHGDRVLECAWRHLTHLSQHTLVGVGEFEKRNVRGESKGALDNEHQGIGQQQQHAIGHKVAVHVHLKVADVARLHQLQREERNEVGHGYEQGALK